MTNCLCKVPVMSPAPFLLCLVLPVLLQKGC